MLRLFFPTMGLYISNNRLNLQLNSNNHRESYILFITFKEEDYEKGI